LSRPWAPKFVAGQQHWPDSGSYVLTGKKGTLGWSFKGNWIPLNPKLTPSGAVNSFTNGRGAWKVTAGTGIFQGWKGGGLYAYVQQGTLEGGTMDAEFDGHVVH